MRSHASAPLAVQRTVPGFCKSSISVPGIKGVARIPGFGKGGKFEMGSAYRVLDRRAKKGFLLRWTFVLCSVSFALLVQSDSSNAKVKEINN